MDRREAIEILEYERDTDFFVSDYRNSVHEAIDLAIEALQEQMCPYFKPDTGECFDHRRKQILGEGDLQPKTLSKTETTNEESISRQAAIEQIDKWHDFYTDSSLRTDKARRDELSAIKAMLINLPSLPPVTPTASEDCISREWVLNEMENGIQAKYYDDKDIVRHAPSVTPTERIGEWIAVEKSEHGGLSIVSMRCNQCWRYAYLVLPKGTKCVYDYCPWCKADMRGDME